MTLQSWHEVLAAKARGSTVLHEVFSKTEELDFFVMTSSISATLGASGQSNYAAGKDFSFSSRTLLTIQQQIRS
jgi:hypothetical protein